MIPLRLASSRFALGGSSRRALAACARLDARAMLAAVDCFVFDCDGVVWKGDRAVAGAAIALDRLRAAGKRLFFVTNNSTRSRAGFKAKFDALGLGAVAPGEILSSSFAAAVHLARPGGGFVGGARAKKAYVIGEAGLCEELALAGVRWVGGPDDSGRAPDMARGGRLALDDDIGAVVVGFDREVNYYKIQAAQLAINELGAEFVATNLDAVTHLTDAQKWAGNGSMVGAIRGCTGREPTVVGKPAPLLIDHLVDAFGLERRRICMVGDRLDTDVRFGIENGLRSCLVLSGVTSEAALLSDENAIAPDCYADTIADLAPDLGS